MQPLPMFFINSSPALLARSMRSSLRDACIFRVSARPSALGSLFCFLRAARLSMSIHVPIAYPVVGVTFPDGYHRLEELQFLEHYFPFGSGDLVLLVEIKLDSLNKEFKS